MAKESYILKLERVHNLDEEMLGVSAKNIQKMLDWLDDNQALSGKGREIANIHFKYHKAKGNLNC